jgi:DNA replication protein DnaC
MTAPCLSTKPGEVQGKLLSDVPAASAILDRLLHHADVIPITGRSYRLQESANERASRKQKPKMDSSAQSEN